MLKPLTVDWLQLHLHEHQPKILVMSYIPIAQKKTNKQIIIGFGNERHVWSTWTLLTTNQCPVN